MAPPPPSPAHILRTHTQPVSVLAFSDDNERLYSGDASGTVVITSTRTLRPLTLWKAHTDSLLGVQEYRTARTDAPPGPCYVLTHARDHKLRVWRYAPDAVGVGVGDAAARPGLPAAAPALLLAMDVNALNYCRFSLLPAPRGAPSSAAAAAAADTGANTDTDTAPSALLAVPNLVDSSFADVWKLPSQKRLHAAVGREGKQYESVLSSPDGRGENKTGIIMSMHLFQTTHPSRSERHQLRLLCAYENGSVTMWGFTKTDRETSVEGIGWDALWTVKLHVESVMAMAVSSDCRLALTVSADHLIGRYDLRAAETGEVDQSCTIHRTRHPGNAAIVIRRDGRICAAAGWDGDVRLFSTKTLKPLGTLEYHKGGCQAVAFAHAPGEPGMEDAGAESDSEEEEMSQEDKVQRSRWLASAGRDGRVAIWALMSFEKAA